MQLVHRQDEEAFCEDIDECASKDVEELCGGANYTCVNTYGGFECLEGGCPEGFALNPATRECEDVDECASANANNCDGVTAICDNLPGGFRCTCSDSLTTHLSEDRTTCVPYDYEYRLLDPAHVRCCGHTTDLTGYMVKAKVKPGGSPG